MTQPIQVPSAVLVGTDELAVTIAGVPRHLSPVFQTAGVLSAPLGSLPFVVPVSCTLDFADLAESQSAPHTGQSIIVDFQVNGVTIYANPSLRSQLAVGVATARTQNTPVTIAAQSLLTAVITQVGSGVPGTGLVAIPHLIPLV